MVESSLVGRNPAETTRHSLLQTLNVSRLRVGEPFVTIIGSGDSCVPNRVRLSGVTRRIGTKVEGTNNIPFRFGAVNIYSNVTVGRGNVGCDLYSHRLVTSSVRIVLATRPLSTVMFVPGYSGVIPNVLLTTYHLGLPYVFISNNPVLPNGDARARGEVNLSRVFRCSNGCFTNGVDLRGLRDYTYATYPAYNSYDNVCATGSVGYLARAVNVSLPKSNAVPTIVDRELHLTGEANREIVRLLGRSVGPNSVVARGSVRGTVHASVTVNYSAGAVLRLATVTRTTNRSVSLGVLSRCNGGAPRVYGLGPTSSIFVASLGSINNVRTIIGRLTGNNVVGASTLAMGNAITSEVTGTPSTSKRVVRALSGPFSGSNNVTIL